MQVSFYAAWIRVRREVHVVPHLNCVLANVERRVSHLAHEVLVCHLQVLLFRLLVLLALQGREQVHLHVLGNVLVRLAGEASWRAFLIVDLRLGTLLIISNHHRLSLGQV